MFPENFYWGAATSSYQVEGAFNEDGKSKSVWDEFSHTDGRIKNGDTGDVACDHYHRFREDVALMKEMGLKAYRFSLSWPRIMPDGVGRVNQKGIQFYRELLKELKSAGIEPFITLYHWDLPIALMERGGWVNPESPDWFAEFARVSAENLSDLCSYFITFNEPSVFVKGYINGRHAPGLKMTPDYYVKAYHNVLKAHGKAVKVLRETAPNIKIGCAPCSIPFIPDTDDDVEACRRQYFAVKRHIDGCKDNPLENFVNIPSMFLDPIVFGRYPEDGLEVIKPYLPPDYEDDLKIISQKIDFIAENIYQGKAAKKCGDGIKLIPLKPGYTRTAIDWNVEPACVYWMLKFIYERYCLPLMISENGISCTDRISLDGRVHDYDRIDYLNRHLLYAEKAVREGIPLFAYTHWSLMDNFEWSRGYYDRFGLIYVDYETGKRTVKDSGYWYKRVIETRGQSLHDFEK